MTNRLALIPAFLFLYGCPSEVEVVSKPEPDPETHAAPIHLDAGSYVLTIEDVKEVTCDMGDPREIVGQQMEMDVRFRGPQAFVELEGLPMEGWMKDSMLRAFASFDEMVEYETSVEDVDTDTDVDTESADAPKRDDRDHAEEGGSTGEDQEAPPDDRPEERPDSEAATHGQVELILAIEDTSHAGGILNVTYSPGCHMGLDVRVRKVGEGSSRPEEEPMPAEETEPCDSEEEDCG